MPIFGVIVNKERTTGKVRDHQTFTVINGTWYISVYTKVVVVPLAGLQGR